MNTDIQHRADIETLITTFYEKAVIDEHIGHYFTKVIQLSMEHHIPIIVAFWERLLFGTGDYKGNPMVKHFQLDHKSKLLPSHFERWTQLFCATVDSLFEGQKAIEAKQKATQIAKLMLFKVKQNRLFNTDSIPKT